MRSSHNLSLNNSLRPNHPTFPDILKRFTNSSLMKISFRGSKISSFRRGNYTNIDKSPTSLRNKRIKNLIIMNKEMNMQPKRVSKHHLSKFKWTPFYRCVFLWLRNRWLTHQLSQQLQISLVRMLSLRFVSKQLLLKHKRNQLQFSVSNNHHVYLLCNNLILHILLSSSEDGNWESNLFTSKKVSHRGVYPWRLLSSQVTLPYQHSRITSTHSWLQFRLWRN